MTIAEFLEVTEEIEKFYGKEDKDKYNKLQANFMYEELRNITKARYRQVAREAYKNCKFMPKPSELIEIERELPKEIVNKTDEKVECERCKGTGMIPYQKKIQDGSKLMEYVFTARCNCSNAVGISQLIPLADEIGV